MIRRAVAMVLVAGLAVSVAFAQLDPGWHWIVQNGVRVGEIYVPPRANNGLYAEHWILYPNYVYPSPSNGVKTEIVPVADNDPSNPKYKSEADFFNRARFGQAYRYVAVTANDSTRFPRP